MALRTALAAATFRRGMTRAGCVSLIPSRKYVSHKFGFILIFFSVCAANLMASACRFGAALEAESLKEESPLTQEYIKRELKYGAFNYAPVPGVHSPLEYILLLAVAVRINLFIQSAFSKCAILGCYDRIFCFF